MRNIRLLIEYEGTHYLGWQRQPQGMTVQEALENTLARIVGKETAVMGAGRTDAGVHARGQVANFRTDSALPVERFHGALNAILPRDIVVLRTDEVPSDFNSRFSARSKQYRYTIWNARTRPAIDRHFCWHVRWALEDNCGQEAARALLGRQDFACFESSNAKSETTVRTVTRADWVRIGPDRVVFTIEADAFLYNMVRAIVGTLCDVARGRLAPERMAEIIACRDRRAAGPTAPAQGLCLMKVEYGEVRSMNGD